MSIEHERESEQYACSTFPFPYYYIWTTNLIYFLYTRAGMITTRHYYSLEIQVCVRQYAVNGGSEILASDWPSQFSSDQWQ